MKLDDLIENLIAIRSRQKNGDCEVVVIGGGYLQNGEIVHSIGPVAHSSIKNAMTGFDWEKGMILLQTETPTFFKLPERELDTIIPKSEQIVVGTGLVITCDEYLVLKEKFKMNGKIYEVKGIEKIGGKNSAYVIREVI